MSVNCSYGSYRGFFNYEAVLDKRFRKKYWIWKTLGVTPKPTYTVISQNSIFVTLRQLRELPQTDEVKVLSMQLALVQGVK